MGKPGFADDSHLLRAAKSSIYVSAQREKAPEVSEPGKSISFLASNWKGSIGLALLNLLEFFKKTAG